MCGIYRVTKKHIYHEGGKRVEEVGFGKKGSGE